MGDVTAGAASAEGPVRVFMSYRRADDRHFIGRLHDRLCEAFGDEMVFRDIDSIPAGTNFRNVILRTLNEVDAVVAVIGPSWARPSDGDESAPPDYVFLELAEALKFGKPVIPVLVEATLMPAADVLPPDLRPLSDIEAISVYGDPAFRRDSARLIEAIGAVVADDRARLARAQQEMEERTRRLAAERLERERHAEELRAEERAARARLAELEDAAARRQIEAERARVEALAEQLRQAELAEQAMPDVAAEPPKAPHVMPLPPPPVEQPKVEQPKVEQPKVEQPKVEQAGLRAEPSSAPRVGARPPWFEILIVAALVLGVVALLVERSVVIDGSVYRFNELGTASLADVLAWGLALAVGAPLVLGNRRVEQRFVLAGVTVSSFLVLLQSSNAVRFGFTGYSEGSWYLARLLQIACLVGAYWIVRQRVVESLPAAPRRRIALVVIAIACGALSIAATYDEWSHIADLIGTIVPGRSPPAVWFVLLALVPIGVTVALASRSSYAAHVSLATIATLGAVNYVWHARVVDGVFHLNASRWMWTAASYLLLAAVAWWAVIARQRSTPSAI